jgi:hypothetical protein
MEKVIALDSATSSYRVYFPKDEALLAQVRELNVRCFHKDWNDPHWIVGADQQSAQGLARIAANFDFIVDSLAAVQLDRAFSDAPALNITATHATGILSGFQVATRYDENVVRMIKSCAGSKWENGTKVWTLPMHTSSIKTIMHLATHYGLSVSTVTLAQAQSAIKRLGWQGYAQYCHDLDALIDQCAAQAPVQMSKAPHFAVLDSAFVSKWVAGAAARQEKAKTGAKAKRTGKRAAERAQERGFEGEAASMTAQQVRAVHANLRALAGVCDGAATVDGVGFSGPDAKVGRGLALLPVLEPLCAAYARSFLTKYTRQLGQAAIDAMGLPHRLAAVA